MLCMLNCHVSGDRQLYNTLLETEEYCQNAVAVILVELAISFKVKSFLNTKSLNTFTNFNTFLTS